MIPQVATRSLSAPITLFRASVVPRSFQRVANRTVTTLAKNAYTAHAQAVGQGRNGRVDALDGDPLKLTLAMPKALGGTGKGQNPEQLFAMGFSSCFLSALGLVARQEKAQLPENLRCEAFVHIGPPAEGNKPFAIAVDLIVRTDTQGQERKKVEELVQKAHEVCPYSNATRNNVPVTLGVEDLD